MEGSMEILRRRTCFPSDSGVYCKYGTQLATIPNKAGDGASASIPFCSGWVPNVLAPDFMENRMKGKGFTGHHHTEAAKEKCREAQLGHPPTKGFAGHRHTRAWKKEHREAMMGEKHPMYGKRGKGIGMYGKHHTEAYKREQAKKMTGRNNPMVGDDPKAVAARKKMSETRTGKYTGENSPQWRGGIAFEPYTPEFSGALKESIRRRDGYKCQLCGCPQEECLTKLIVHHVDYGKKNSSPENLTALCRPCNSKVNFNRKYWTEYFREKILAKKGEK